MAKNFSVERARHFNRVGLSLVQSEIRFESTICFISQVDLTQVETLRRNSSKEERPSYTAIVAKAVAKALTEFPYANRRIYRPLFWLWGWKIQTFSNIDISVAIERNIPNEEAATFIDVLRDVDQQSLAQITARLRELAKADVQNNRQWRDYYNLVMRFPVLLGLFIVRLPYWIPAMWVKYRGGATMISAPSRYGVDTLVGSWTAPLGVSFGLVHQRPIVKDGEVVAATTVDFFLNWHRGIMAGAQAARFFARIVEIIESADFD